MQIIDCPDHGITDRGAFEPPRVEYTQVCLFAHMKQRRLAGIHVASIASLSADLANLQPVAEPGGLDLYFNFSCQVG